MPSNIRHVAFDVVSSQQVKQEERGKDGNNRERMVAQDEKDTWKQNRRHSFCRGFHVIQISSGKFCPFSSGYARGEKHKNSFCPLLFAPRQDERHKRQE